MTPEQIGAGVMYIIMGYFILRIGRKIRKNYEKKENE